MKHVVIAVSLGILISGNGYAADRHIEMSTNPVQAVLGETVQLQCTGDGEWRSPLVSAKIVVENARGRTLVKEAGMKIDGMTASYDYAIPSNEKTGNWKFKCVIKDRSERGEREFLVLSCRKIRN